VHVLAGTLWFAPESALPSAAICELALVVPQRHAFLLPLAVCTGPWTDHSCALLLLLPLPLLLPLCLLIFPCASLQ
jgi:hypothetical protein